MFSHSRIVQSRHLAYKFSMSLKLHIRDIRKAQKLTLAVVAGRAGISIPHLSEIERGEKNLNNHLLQRISAALGVRPQDLFSGEIEEHDADARARLADAIRSLHSEESLRKLADLAETFALAEKASAPRQ